MDKDKLEAIERGLEKSRLDLEAIMREHNAKRLSDLPDHIRTRYANDDE